jgi:hypothetical protein
MQDEILKKISKFAVKSKWIVLGEVVSELESISLPDAQHISWLKVAVEKMSAEDETIGMGYGYKIVRTYNFLKRLSEKYPDIHPDEFDGCPIGAIEIATRIFKFDQDQCVNSLRSIKSGVSASEINTLYQDIKRSNNSNNDARNNAALSQRLVTKKAVKYVLENSENLYGLSSDKVQIASVKGRRKSTGVGVTFFSKHTSKNNESYITGFDVISVSKGSSNWYSLREKVCFAATFFHAYWLFICCSVNDIGYIKNDLAVLEVLNAGVIHYFENQFRVIQHPTGKPIPDRRHLF